MPSLTQQQAMMNRSDVASFPSKILPGVAGTFSTFFPKGYENLENWYRLSKMKKRLLTEKLKKEKLPEIGEKLLRPSQWREQGEKFTTRQEVESFWEQSPEAKRKREFGEHVRKINLLASQGVWDEYPILKLHREELEKINPDPYYWVDFLEYQGYEPVRR